MKEITEPLGAFQLLRDECWRQARPLVPLFGAGISVEAGIPLIGPIESYLKLLKWCYNKRLIARDWRYLHEFLFEYGWPTRQEIHQLVRANAYYLNEMPRTCARY